MTRRFFVVLWLGACLALGAGCAPREPVGGCVLAAARQRAALRASPEVRRARAYVGAAFPAAILGLHVAGQGAEGHAALVYRLESGWWAYDDIFASRPLHLPAQTLPDPVIAARAAFPGRRVTGAEYLDPVPAR